MEEESDSFSVTSVGEGDGETWTFVNTKQFPINGGKPLEDSDNCSDHGSDGSSIVIIDDLNPQVNNLGAVEESRPSIADVYGEDDEKSSGSAPNSPNIKILNDFSEVSENSGLKVNLEEHSSSDINYVQKKWEDRKVHQESLTKFTVYGETDVSKEAGVKVSQEFDTQILEKVDTKFSTIIKTEVCKKVDPEDVCNNISPEICEEVSQEVCEEVVREVREEVGQEVREAVVLEVCEEVGTEVCKEVSQEVCKEVSQEVCKEVSQTVCEEVSQTVCEEVSQTVLEEVGQTVCEEVCKEADPQISEEVGQVVSKEGDTETSKETVTLVTLVPERNESPIPVDSELKNQVSDTDLDSCLGHLENAEESARKIYDVQGEQKPSTLHHNIPVNLEQAQSSTEPEIYAETVDIPEGLAEVEEISSHQTSEEFEAEMNHEKEMLEDFCSDDESFIEELMDQDDLFETNNERELLDNSTTESDSLIDSSPGSSILSNLEQSPTPLMTLENRLRPTKPDLLHEATHLEEELDQLDYSCIGNQGLPDDLNIANIFRERHYVHRPNQRLNVQLSYFVAFVMAAVIGFALGHVIGLSDNFPPRCPVSNQMNGNPEQYKEWSLTDLQFEVQRLGLLNKELNRALGDIKKSCRVDVQNELKSENWELKHAIGRIRYGRPTRSVEDTNAIDRLQSENEQLRTLVQVRKDDKETNLAEYWEQLIEQFAARNTTKELDDFVKKTTSVIDVIAQRRKEVSDGTQQFIGHQMEKKLQSLTRKLVLLLKGIFTADECSVQITDKDQRRLAEIHNDLESHWIQFQSRLKGALADNRLKGHKGLNADWFLSMGRQREKIRREERQTEWMFDRAQKRQNERSSRRIRGDSNQPNRRFNQYSH